MLWHATSPCTEESADGRFTIRWRKVGFGIWVAEAWCGDTKLEEWASSERADAGEKARQACQRHAWGWMAA
jgi:hypothetical protein